MTSPLPAGGLPVPPLKVVEVASGPAAAYAARLLAALGADVTRLDDGRPPDRAAAALDTGKSVLALDAPAAAALVAGADVLVFAGSAEHLPANVRAALRPELITAAVTPFGEHGPHAGWQGSDLIATHAGGLGYGTPPRITDPENEYPIGLPGDPVALLCGLVLTGGVLHALLERDRDGQGRHVELSAQEVVASCMFNNIGGAAGDGQPASRLAASRPDARKPVIPCSDGAVAAMVTRPAHLRAWLELLGPEARPLLDRLAAGETAASLRLEIDALADAWAATRSKHEVAALGQARHVPVAPVLGPDEILASSQLAARGFWLAGADRDGTPLRIPGHPFGPVAAGDGPRRLPAHAPPGNAAQPLPLSGIRVVDFGWVFAGPIGTRILAALGAEVIRIENPRQPDQMRARPFTQRIIHADKRSAVIDLKQPEGRAAVLAMIRDADVVAENFAPGAMERLGLDWPALHALNPRLIMVSVSGMGQTGPLRHWAMLGQLAQGYAGMTAMVGYEGGPPRGIEDGGFWTDPVAGYSAAVATLAALRERTVTGRGRRVDVSLVEATAALFVRPLLAAQRGDIWGPRGNYHPDMAPHDVYRCAGDDRWLAVSVRTDEQWRALCTLIGRPDLAADPALATLAGRQQARHALRDAITPWTRQHPAEEAAVLMQAAGVPAAPSHDAVALLADPHPRARGFFREDADAPFGITMAAFPPWRLHPDAAMRWGFAPDPGDHTAAVPAAGD